MSVSDRREHAFLTLTNIHARQFAMRTKPTFSVAAFTSASAVFRMTTGQRDYAS